MLAAIRVSKTYHRRVRFGRLNSIQALVDVSIEIPEASTLAVVGRSGSGKSTLARCLSGHELPDTGDIMLEGTSFRTLKGDALRRQRRAVQLVFQNAAMTFSPWMNLEAVVSEPMSVIGTPSMARRQRCIELLEQVQIPGHWLTRTARELSGGERNRVAIARALAAEPRVLVLDEVSSGLDLITAGHLFGLLQQLQQARRLSYIVITHDLRVAAQMGDTIAVMDRGRLVEQRSGQQLFTPPHHSCTKALIDAVTLPAVCRTKRPKEDGAC